MNLSVTPRLTVESWVGSGEEGSIGSIARIKMRVQVRSALWKYNKSEIQRYTTPDGKVPFDEWFDSLRDLNAQLKINVRLKRVIAGNLGDFRSVGEGVFEFKIDCGPGYRVYFGQVGLTLVLLLCGGDKSSQNQDISKAKEYWTNYRS